MKTKYTIYMRKSDILDKPIGQIVVSNDIVISSKGLFSSIIKQGSVFDNKAKGSLMRLAHNGYYRITKKDFDGLIKSENLQKRSKNVREKTRNITEDQALSRRLKYLKSLGLNLREKNDSDISYKGFPDQKDNDLSYGISFPAEHEAAHAMMTPPGKKVSQYIRELSDNFSDESAITAENIANRIENLIDRRSGVGVGKKGGKNLNTTNTQRSNVFAPSDSDKRDEYIKKYNLKKPHEYDSRSEENKDLTAAFGDEARKYISKFDMGAKFKEGEITEPSKLKKYKEIPSVISDSFGKDEITPYPDSKHIETKDLGDGLYHHIYDRYTDDDFMDIPETVHIISADKDPSGKGLSVVAVDVAGTVNFSATDPAHKGKGYGKMAYMNALKHHGNLRSDNQMSAKANKVYQWLSKQPGVHVRFSEKGDNDRHEVSYHGLKHEDKNIKKSNNIWSKLSKSQKDCEIVPDMKNVSCVAIVSGNKILMGNRRDSGKWNFPGGGADKNENPLQCAIRELKEEASIKPDKIRYLGSKIIDGKDNKKVAVHAFAATGLYYPDSSRDPDKEISHFKWFDVSNGLPKDLKDSLHNKKDVALEFLGIDH